MIHLFKYQGKLGLGRRLAQLMNQHYPEKWPASSFDLVIPVPLHRKKLRQREFDQTLVLARAISRGQKIPLLYGNLIRKNWTQPQTNLDRRDRRLNVKDAFEVVRPESIQDLCVLLVDDVYTTGATINECTRALLRAGAREVYVYTLARA